MVSERQVSMRNILETCPPGVLLSSGFGAWLKEEREKRGWTQQIIADRAEVTKTTIWRFETDARDPARETAERIGRALATDDSTDDNVRMLVDRALFAAGFVPSGQVVRSFDPEDPMLEVLDAADGLSLDFKKSMAESARAAGRLMHSRRTDIIGKRAGEADGDETDDESGQKE